MIFDNESETVSFAWLSPAVTTFALTLPILMLEISGSNFDRSSYKDKNLGQTKGLVQQITQQVKWPCFYLCLAGQLMSTLQIISACFIWKNMSGLSFKDINTCTLKTFKIAKLLQGLRF